MFDLFCDHEIIRRAINQKKISASTLNIRDFAEDKHQVTDDRPYGGGSGMVMKPEPLAGAIRAAKRKCPSAKTILLSPQGRVFNQALANELASFKGLVLVCGRYEGVDERILNYVGEEISIGDYVLSGGELPVLVVMDAITRLLPGALGDADSALEDSFMDGLLDCPHYTRPELVEGRTVPDVLISGDHERIRRWRLQQALGQTWLRRPELIETRRLSSEERDLLDEFIRAHEGT